MAKDILTCIVSGVLIEKDGKFLLVQEKKPSAYGLWNLPAGHVEEGETLEQAAIKEAKEETGFDVELVKKLGVFQENALVPPFHVFLAKIIGGDLNLPQDEILDAKWLAPDEFGSVKDKLRREFISEIIEALK